MTGNSSIWLLSITYTYEAYSKCELTHSSWSPYKILSSHGSWNQNSGAYEMTVTRQRPVNMIPRQSKWATTAMNQHNKRGTVAKGIYYVIRAYEQVQSWLGSHESWWGIDSKWPVQDQYKVTESYSPEAKNVRTAGAMHWVLDSHQPVTVKEDIIAGICYQATTIKDELRRFSV
jgi:hypothetical protein